MTYAVALRLEHGLVFAADTRTNAGIDNIAQYRKLQLWCNEGDRVLVLLGSGNLANAPWRSRQADAAVVRLDAAFEPLGRNADRCADL